MGILRRFREWREDKDGVLTGPDINADSLSADDATVNNPPSADNDALRWQEGVESGTVTLDGVDNSGGTDGWGDSAFANTSIAFDNAFSAEPEVVISGNDDDDDVTSNQYKVNAGIISKTGFDFRAWQMSTDDNSGVTDAYAADYIATEGR